MSNETKPVPESFHQWWDEEGCSLAIELTTKSTAHYAYIAGMERVKAVIVAIKEML